jgi:hypothetical protein
MRFFSKQFWRDVLQGLWVLIAHAIVFAVFTFVGACGAHLLSLDPVLDWGMVFAGIIVGVSLLGTLGRGYRRSL